MKEKHIEKLTRGKKSGANIGSRNVPHRLRPYEHDQFTRAIRQRFLRVPFDSRQNVVNIWRKYCEAKAWPCVILYQHQSGRAELESNACKDGSPNGALSPFQKQRICRGKGPQGVLPLISQSFDHISEAVKAAKELIHGRV